MNLQTRASNIREENEYTCEVYKKDSYDRDTKYWNSIYKKNGISMEPSPFAKEVLEYVEPKKSLLELGCGNGRDSIYFARNGMNVVAVDASESAIGMLNDENQMTNAVFLCDDFVNSREIYKTSYDYVYSRFTIHAIDENQEKELLRNVYQSMVKGGIFFIEVRGTKNALYGKGIEVGRNAFIYNDHYRRFIVKDELITTLRQMGFSIEYQAEKTGFAPFGDEDYAFIRIIARK